MNWEAGQPQGQGSPEGLLQADRRELELVAKQMLKHRMDSTVVVTLTGLSADEVSVLKAMISF